MQVRTTVNLGSTKIVVEVSRGPGFQSWLNLGSRTWVAEPGFEQLFLGSIVV